LSALHGDQGNDSREESPFSFRRKRGSSCAHFLRELLILDESVSPETLWLSLEMTAHVECVLQKIDGVDLAHDTDDKRI
jgi:hypothetical protein